jgi:hypothetical protein
LNHYEQPVEDLPDVRYHAGMNKSDYKSDLSDYEELGSNGKEIPTPASKTGSRIDRYTNVRHPPKNLDSSLLLKMGLIQDP